MNTRMADDTKQLVAELISLAPELAGREQELREVVRALVALRPEARPDAAFVAELKQRLVGRIPAPAPRASSFTFAMLSPLKFTYALGGLAALAVVALVIVSTVVPLSPKLGRPSPLGGLHITRVGANAFGPIEAGQTAAATGLGGGGQVAMRSQAESAPAAPNAAPAPASDTVATVGMADAPQADAKLIAPAGPDVTVPAYTTYHYSYVGDELKDLPVSVEVLRRVKGITSASASALINSLKFGGMNLGSFGGSQLQQFTAAQDQEFGYSISVDLLEGAVNIFENWRRWPNPAAQCQDEACFKQYQMDFSAVPADADVIALADAFLNEHGISRADYGEPYVQSDWRVQYEQTQDKSQAYVPEVLTVLYPLVLEGRSVYEQYGGAPMGLGVNVNVRYGRVSGLWNLMTQNYEASAYDAANSVDAILAYLNSQNQGYPMPLMYPVPEGQPSQPEQVEIGLGTPTLGYMRYWQYQNNESKELLLPALVFPVQTAQTTYAYYPKQVVAPLVKEFLISDNSGGPIRIMNSAVPPASVGGSSGSSGSGTMQVLPMEDAPSPVPVEPEM